MAIRPRPEIEAVEPAVHGGLNYVELERWGLKPEEIIDFSVNINPFGPSPRAPAALAKARLDRYPDSQAVFLRRRLAEVNGLDPENIIVGNGTTEIIRLLALTYLRPGDGVLIVGPTFGEYRVASQLMGARIVTYTAPKECAFWPDISEITSLIQRESPRLIFLCNPNNPTGVYLKRREVEDILAACRGSLPVLDEAYRAFVTGAWSSASLIKGGSLIILRSMTKDHALAGLRLGYALGDAEVVASL
ncbi:MAG: histidinol-phosphate transaminase, partial [Anaerolineae bacterium]